MKGEVDMADGVYQFTGARYVPLFAEPIEWSSARQYESLTIVTHKGDSYTSRQNVPVGKDISDGDYWVKTGNFNAQVAAMERSIRNLEARVTALEKKVGA